MTPEMNPSEPVGSMITIIAPLDPSRVAGLRETIATTLGNPDRGAFGSAVETESLFLHFASLHALTDSTGQKGYLIFELSADGTDEAILNTLASRAGTLLTPIFELAQDWRAEQKLATYLLGHRLRNGYHLHQRPGLAFCGTPGLSVQTIRDEAVLSAEAARIVQGLDPTLPPLEKLKSLRATLERSDQFRWALGPLAAIKNGDRQKSRSFALELIAFFLWPLLVFLLPICLWLAWPDRWVGTLGAGTETTLSLMSGALRQILLFAAALFGLMTLLVGLTLGLVYFRFRAQEQTDKVSERRPDPTELGHMFERENQPGHVQNHMVSRVVMKRGLLRRLTIRLAFWAVARNARANPKPGHLGDIGTIHFARWVALPGTRDLLFFSNFGGSWESYLEDFITKAHQGLTAVWSNTEGFPRTRNLVQDGATDGERFKRFARESMFHTPFWYSAYPRLSTANIRANHAIRADLAVLATEAVAVDLLSRFGSSMRPIDKLELTQIQSLVFGGMGFKPDGRLLVIRLGTDVETNRHWLRGVLPYVSFNDGRYAAAPAVLTLACGAPGLRKLGLDDKTLATFPTAFVEGMQAKGRDRILGDIGTNASEHWLWGATGVDVALLIYGDQVRSGAPRPIDALDRTLSHLTQTAGGEVLFRQALTPVGDTLADRKEPFGFVDGVSQPAIRGTYRGLRNADPIHLVEPGEFVLGYPDNHGTVPPGPMMGAAQDPAYRLPLASAAQGYPHPEPDTPRQPGYNGSFLVIRQLEQDAAGFAAFCRSEGARLQAAFPDLPLVAQDMEHYVGAKMIGRWQDGSSMVRNPYLSASRLQTLTGKDPGLAAARPEQPHPDPNEQPIAAAGTSQAEALVQMQKVASANSVKDGAENESSTTVTPIVPDNDFLFGTEDPQGFRCPYGAHIRRVNPRESLSPGSR